MESRWGFETICQHLAEDYSFAHAVAPPIIQTSLFVYDDFDKFTGRDDADLNAGQCVYTRVQNPTTEIAEKKIAALEGTDRCRLFGSGMGAISAAILHSTKAGGHVVCTDAAYGPTKILLRDWLPKFGVETTFIDGRDTSAVEAALRPNTSLIYMESPGTFKFHIQDIAAICGIAKQRKILTALDNSNATPIFQQPAKFGVDMVVHSATKYLAGHSDVVAGALCGSEELMKQLVFAEGLLLGAVLGPFEAWLMIRSLRTLPIRMERHRANAQVIAKFLSSHPKVEQVFYPGLSSHDGYDLANKQMSGTSGLVSFKTTFADDRAKVKAFCEGLELFQMGVSWGGHESLIVPLCQEETDNRWMLRLSVGLETVDDLVNDLDKQLSRA